MPISVIHGTGKKDESKLKEVQWRSLRHIYVKSSTIVLRMNRSERAQDN